MADWDFIYKQSKARWKEEVATVATKYNISPDLVLSIWGELQMLKAKEMHYSGDACAVSEDSPPRMMRKCRKRT